MRSARPPSSHAVARRRFPTTPRGLTVSRGAYCAAWPVEMRRTRSTRAWRFPRNFTACTRPKMIPQRSFNTDADAGAAGGIESSALCDAASSTSTSSASQSARALALVPFSSPRQGRLAALHVRAGYQLAAARHRLGTRPKSEAGYQLARPRRLAREGGSQGSGSGSTLRKPAVCAIGRNYLAPGVMM